MTGDRLKYEPALDGIRGVAILLVLGYHAWQHPSSGFFGVDVFFVLSGFLITRILFDEINRTGTINLRRFYVRRARRLLPALFAFLVVLTVLDPARTPERSAARLAAGAFYVMNIVRAATDSKTLPGMGQLWSLAQEEQFYLIWPALLVLACARWSPRRLARALATAAATIAVYRIVLLSLGVDHERIYFAPDTHADPIIVGCLLAVAYPHLRNLRTWKGILAAASVIAFSATMLPYSTLSLAAGTPVVSGCAALLIVAALQEKSVVSRLLRSAPLVWVGTISYSLYLWQQLTHKLIPDGTLAAAFSILIAWLSARYIERPFRHPRTPVNETALESLPVVRSG